MATFTNDLMSNQLCERYRKYKIVGIWLWSATSISIRLRVCKILVRSMECTLERKTERKNRIKNRQQTLTNLHVCYRQFSSLRAPHSDTTNIQLISKCFTSSLLSGFFTFYVFSSSLSFFFRCVPLSNQKKNQHSLFCAWEMFNFEKRSRNINCALGFGFVCYGKNVQYLLLLMQVRQSVFTWLSFYIWIWSVGCFSGSEARPKSNGWIE